MVGDAEDDTAEVPLWRVSGKLAEREKSNLLCQVGEGVTSKRPTVAFSLFYDFMTQR